ncbi:UNVERIFIED_CONTAM: hypothetical protein FKN15_034406 [Acipenser sinensis]
MNAGCGIKDWQVNVTLQFPGDGCGHSVLGQESGVLTSKNYPGTYPNHTWCKWKIQVPEGKTIILKFGDLDIEAQHCESDYVKIFKGTQTFGNDTTMNAGCGIKDWQVNVTLQFPDKGKTIILKFGDLDIEALHCESDYVKIFKGTQTFGNDTTMNAGCGIKDWQVNVTLQFPAFVTYCGNLKSYTKEIHVDTNEITVQFESGHHLTGRGFLLSYATSNHKDLLTCLDKASHFPESQFSKYCPAGCKAVAGDVSGDKSEGYRHTSVLCKAAIHAGVILDELGGQISVIQDKGLGRYEGIKANGIQTKEGSLSDKRIVFSTNDCSKPLVLDSGAITATSAWQQTNENGQITEWSAENGRLDVQGSAWAADHNNTHQWMLIDLGEKKNITGIITSGSTLPGFNFYVQSYTIKHSKDGHKWRMHRQAGGIITSGSTLPGFNFYVQSYTIKHSKDGHKWRMHRQAGDYQQPLMIGTGTVTRKGSTFRPIDIDAKEEIGRQDPATHYDYLQTANQYALPLTNQEPEYATPIIERHNFREDGYTPDTGYNVPAVGLSKKPSFNGNDCSRYNKQESLTGDYQTPQVISESTLNEDAGYDRPKLSIALATATAAIFVVPAILSLVLLFVGVCVYKALRKKRTKENAYGLSDAPKAGCWQQIKQPFAKHQSTEFTISYSPEKEMLKKLDVVKSNMEDYQQPLMIGTGTVTRKGSTFRPIDIDAKEEIGRQDPATHYDYLQTANQYALPLTNQEPEYATPIIKRHNFRKDGYTPDTGYNVPAVGLSKKPSFNGNDCSRYNKQESLTGDYQTPQVISESTLNEDAGYDRPKLSIALATATAGTDYQKPQVTLSVTEGYSVPRDCLKPASPRQQ